MSRSDGQRGVTLIELLVAIGLGTVFCVTASKYFGVFRDSLEFISGSATAKTAATVAMSSIQASHMRRNVSLDLDSKAETNSVEFGTSEDPRLAFAIRSAAAASTSVTQTFYNACVTAPQGAVNLPTVTTSCSFKCPPGKVSNVMMKIGSGKDARTLTLVPTAAKKMPGALADARLCVGSGDTMVPASPPIVVELVLVTYGVNAQEFTKPFRAIEILSSNVRDENVELTSKK